MIIGLSLYQIILIIISLIFLFSGITKFFRREKSQTLFKLISTIFIWGAVLVFSIFPELTHSISKKLGLGENLNTLIFIGFVILFMIVFKIINILERIERNISEIVRKEALEKIERK